MGSEPTTSAIFSTAVTRDCFTALPPDGARSKDCWLDPIISLVTRVDHTKLHQAWQQGSFWTPDVDRMWQRALPSRHDNNRTRRWVVDKHAHEPSVITVIIISSSDMRVGWAAGDGQERLLSCFRTSDLSLCVCVCEWEHTSPCFHL